jgi:hypothetical protein
MKVHLKEIGREGVACTELAPNRVLNSSLLILCA